MFRTCAPQVRIGRISVRYDTRLFLMLIIYVYQSFQLMHSTLTVPSLMIFANDNYHVDSSRILPLLDPLLDPPDRFLPQEAVKLVIS